MLRFFKEILKYIYPFISGYELLYTNHKSTEDSSSEFGYKLLRIAQILEYVDELLIPEDTKEPRGS